MTTTRATTVRARFTSLKAWELEPEPTTFAPAGSRWSNKDMDPTPPHARTWTQFNYITYWLSDAYNVATWNMAGAMLAVGLSWKLALVAIAIGHFLIALIITANGNAGARLRVPFPVLNRSSFGFWFSYFSVVPRAVLGCFWFGIQTFSGSECVYQMIKAIWPSFARFPNHLPASTPITSAGMLCYFIYWLIQFPFLLVSPQRIRWLFLAKVLIVPATWFAMMIWAFVRTSEKGSGSVFGASTTLHGSALAWAWLSALNSALGNFATLAVNIPDFTRYARSPRDQYIQLLIIPVSFTLAAFIGIAVTSAGTVLYGDVYWDPLRLIDQWDNRAAAFFAALSFSLATLTTNIAANSLSAGNDFTALWPKYLNIKRGQIICAFIGGWALCPWEILANAIGFLNFMAGYTVFLGPISGIMVTDFYFVHKQNIDIPSLYRPNGRYRYTAGVNWRAVAALVVSVPPNMPGLINAINPNIDVGGGVYPFKIAFLLGFILASGTYWLTSTIFPAHETMLNAPIYSDRDDVTDDNRIINKEPHEKEEYDDPEKNTGL
ncbi:NCS1 nucleoside transporter family [Auriculariales sp. MPI-PUGE-AT-0066]|nr:NCS1 nucleoside transporter family [Auriculariales sp. MPI-PUGE-AT-0066]